MLRATFLYLSEQPRIFAFIRGNRLARRLASEHAQRGQGYLSAPVFGRPDAARSRQLIVVAAGPSDLVELCRPLFGGSPRASWRARPLIRRSPPCAS